MTPPDDHHLNRREFLIVGSAGAASLVMPFPIPAQAQGTIATEAATGMPYATSVSLTVNGEGRDLLVDNRATLLDALREGLRMTGTKKGCDHGQCGACTVLVNGQRTYSCLTLAVMHEEDEVTTIEGLGTEGELHPMQEAFLRHDGYQCGYCTPGQICSAVGALEEVRRGVPSHVTADLAAAPVASPDELRERLSGNICRCGAYANILKAVVEVSGEAA